MALKFIDGFDHYDVVLEKWDADEGLGGYTFDDGRFGGFAVKYPFQNGGPLTKNIPGGAVNEVFVGLAFFQPSIETDELLQFEDSGGNEIGTVRHLSSGEVEIRRGGDGGTILDTSTTTPFQGGTWHYVECHYHPDDSSGTFEVKVDETVVATFAGDTTTNGTDVSAIRIFGDGTNAPRYLIDDLYILDETGTTNNTYLGDVRVITKAPTADTSESSFQPTTGTDNFAMVNEINTIDDDNSYVENGTLGATDRYTSGSLGATGTIHGVQLATSARKTDTKTRKYRHSIKSGATEKEDTAEIPLTASYTMDETVYEVDPNTSSAWTASAVDNLEFGFKITTAE